MNNSRPTSSKDSRQALNFCSSRVLAMVRIIDQSIIYCKPRFRSILICSEATAQAGFGFCEGVPDSVWLARYNGPCSEFSQQGIHTMNKQLPRLILGLSILLPVLASALFLLVSLPGQTDSDFSQTDTSSASTQPLANHS
jgi:hypothetical protein